MISKEKFMPMEFFKKEAFKGSIKGMRYRVKKEEEGLEAVVYPEPFCFEATSEEKKTRKMFPFSEEGRQQVIDWLNEQYEERKEEWESAARY
ncbi:MAG TPA: GNAT family acetyltransferase [Candidatus Hungatella pullicola]|nr:GNAT family acetyltransferase [Candidatus Hungatella pullicola]